MIKKFGKKHTISEIKAQRASQSEKARLLWTSEAAGQTEE